MGNPIGKINLPPDFQINLKTPEQKQKADTDAAKVQQESRLVKDEKLGIGARIKRFFNGKQSGKRLASKSLKQAKAEGLTSTQVRVKKGKKRTAQQVAANIVTLGGYGRNIASKHKKSQESNPELYHMYTEYKDNIRAYLNETNISAIKNEFEALKKERDNYGIQQQGGGYVFPLEHADKSKRLAELEGKLREYEAVIQCKRDITTLMRLDLTSEKAESIKQRLNLPDTIKAGTMTGMI